MAENLGFISLSGRLAADPETKQVGDYTLGTFTLARSQYNGKGKEETTAYWKVEVWGGLTNIMKFLRKGTHTTVHGDPRIDTVGEGDSRKYYTKIKATGIELDGKMHSGSETDAGLKEKANEKKAPASGAGF